jgi:hypothetical protein
MRAVSESVAKHQDEVKGRIDDETLDLDAGRVTLDQCPELGRLIEKARSALSEGFPRRFIYEGRNYRLAVRGRLFIYIGDEVPDPHTLPLLPDGVDVLDALSDDLKPR